MSQKLELERLSLNLPSICYKEGIISINHRKFADDTIMMGGALTTIAWYFKRILDRFLSALGGATYDKKKQDL